ncbi:hypothetical protein ABZP36_030418 [Zizania latifolia]
MERAAAAAKGAWRDGAVTYLHLLFYIAISSGQIFFNKASKPQPTPSDPILLLRSGRRLPLHLLTAPDPPAGPALRHGGGFLWLFASDSGAVWCAKLGRIRDF